MKKKRLLFIISQLHLGGAESSTVEMLRKMPRNAYDIDLIVMNQVPVEGAVSLIPQVPEWVNVCDAFQERMKQAQPMRHYMIRWADNVYFAETALHFVENKTYDMAIHIGEWWKPTFLALVVNAKKKAVWIHTDIASAGSFLPNEYFTYDERIHQYLFVSRHSMENALRKFTFLKGRCGLLHNVANQEAIRAKSEENTDLKRNSQLPLIVSVANVRPEKGHLRALEAMRLLQERGKKFIWWNIGFPTGYPELTAELKNKIAEYGLEDRFLLLGAKENPYPLMVQADAVSCLSDYESWSMVITEAKALGIPVIATKTSGAVEQIEHHVTGYLTDDEPEAVADGLEKLLFNKGYNKELRNNLVRDPMLHDSVSELEAELQKPCKDEIPGGDRILYVIDDVNYRGGAHVAVFNHMDALLRLGRKIDIFSGTAPGWEMRNRFPGIRFWTYDYSDENKLCMRRVLACYLDPQVTRKDRKIRLQYWKQRKNINFPLDRRKIYAEHFFSMYSTVCLLSEGSMFKDAVANCAAPDKIQWIHTDYCSWREVSWYTRLLAKDDPQRWQKIDKIVVLSPLLKRSLIQLFPQFTDKIFVAGNLMDEEAIRGKALPPAETPPAPPEEQPVQEASPAKQSRYEAKIKKRKQRTGKAAQQETGRKPEAIVPAAKEVQPPKPPVFDEATEALLRSMEDGRLQFVSCFRFEPVKNAPVIIHAIARLAAVTRAFHWTFIGEGEEWEQVKALASENGLGDVVTFAGQMANPFPLMKKADVFAQFSKYEGLPNTIYEALILGTPVLSSNVGAIADQITPGETGWLVAPKEDALYEALVYIVNHPGIVKQYRQNLEHYHFDNDTVIRQLETIFPG